MNISVILKQPQVLKSISILTIAAMIFSVSTPVVALAHTPNVTNSDHSVSDAEISQALAYTPGVLSASDNTLVSSDADSALKTSVAGAVIDVPKDASDGVGISGTNGFLDISLPNAGSAKNAKQLAHGVVAYAGSNGSANAIQTTDSGVRMLTIIDNLSAPREYDYAVAIHNEGWIELHEDGGAAVVGRNGELLGSIAAPWAKDANGRSIKTRFATDGLTLTQHIEHNIPDVAYPVTADPAWFAVAGGVVGWAATRCAATALGDLGLSGVRWALRNGDWKWNRKLEDSIWACAWGIAGGGVLRFAPKSVKSWTASQIHNLTRSILKWK